MNGFFNELMEYNKKYDVDTVKFQIKPDFIKITVKKHDQKLSEKIPHSILKSGDSGLLETLISNLASKLI